MDMTHEETAINAVAQGMWDLIKPSNEEDWTWCQKNEPGTAAELRIRARFTLVRGGLLVSKSRGPAPALDLRFKDALLRL